MDILVREVEMDTSRWTKVAFARIRVYNGFGVDNLV